VSVGDQRPRYVLSIEPVSRTVTIGTAEQAGVTEVRTATPTWTGAAPELPFRSEVQLRAHGAPVPCEVLADEDGGLRILLDEEQRGVAPGQSAVLYEPDPVRGDRVLGQAAMRRIREREETVRH
jgi:tRNA-uridine 2-sulfurtransferase